MSSLNVANKSTDTHNNLLIPTTNSPPVLDERGLHTYQQFCVDFLEQHPQCALFLDCGLGKTIITLSPFCTPFRMRKSAILSTSP